jgi:hypothetical protein
MILRRRLLSIALFGLAACLAACPTPVKSEENMPEGFEKALSAFQAHAASKLQVAADQLGIVPKSEALARDWKVPSGRTDLLPIVGRAWAFEAAKVGTPFPTERGWALPDGTIITREQNLGRLFQEAGLWDKAPTMPFSEVAPRLVWTLGPAYRPTTAVPATFELAPDGSAKGMFGADGSSPGGPTRIVRFTVTLKPDRTATFSVDR